MKSKTLPDINPSRLSRAHELREALELSLVLLGRQARELKVLREELRKVQDELLRLNGDFCAHRFLRGYKRFAIQRTSSGLVPWERRLATINPVPSGRQSAFCSQFDGGTRS